MDLSLSPTMPSSKNKEIIEAVSIFTGIILILAATLALHYKEVERNMADPETRKEFKLAVVIMVAFVLLMAFYYTAKKLTTK